MFFPTYGLHRLKTQFSPDIDGGNSETTVGFSLVPDSTILVLGANTNTVPLAFSPDINLQTTLVLGSNTNTVPLAFGPDDVNLIVSTVETTVPLTLQV
jgi:hypothetical protein